MFAVLNSFYLKKSGQRLLILTLVVALLIFLLITLVDAVNVQKPVSKEHSEWNKGWLLVDSAGNSAQVTLPQTMKYGNGGATLSRVLDDRVEAGDSVLCLCSKYEDLSVYLDGQLIYTYPTEDSALADVTGITTHYLQLPQDAVGAELIIRYKFQNARSMIYEIDAPEFAEKETFLSRAVTSSIPFTVIAIVVALAGIVVILMTLRVQGNQTLSNTFWNIGVFALLFAVFLLVRTPYAPFVLGNPVSRYFLTYVTLLLMPIPFVSLFFDVTDEKYRKFQILAVVLNFVNVAAQTGLSLLRVVDYRAMLPLTFLLTVFSMGTVIVGVYRSKNTENDAPWIDDTAVLVAVGALVDLFLVIIGHPSLCSCLFFTVGVVLFLIAQFSYFLYAYSGQFRTNVETMLLQEMAYKDMLTGISNRNAYELYLTDITARPPGDRMYGLIADINDLKRTNDTYGHEMGDTIIVTVSDILYKIFGKNGTCFRLGGDEFVAFVRGMSAEQMEQHIAEFKSELDKYNEDHVPTIRVALGYAETEPDDYRNMKAFLRRIDKMMYEDKRTGKALDKLHAMEQALNDEQLDQQVEASFAVSSIPDTLNEPIETINEITAQPDAPASEEASSDAE